MEGRTERCGLGAKCASVLPQIHICDVIGGLEALPGVFPLIPQTLIKSDVFLVLVKPCLTCPDFKTSLPYVFGHHFKFSKLSHKLKNNKVIETVEYSLFTPVQQILCTEPLLIWTGNITIYFIILMSVFKSIRNI